MGDENQQAAYATQLRRNEELSIKFRLDPSPILFDLQKKLQGGHEQYYEDKEGDIKSKWISTGKKLLNDKGIQKVMTHATSIINNATVLGNFQDTNEKTRFFLFWKNNLRKELYINKYEYGMTSSSDVNHVLIVLSSFADLFLTRLIKRKEAEGLEKTHQIMEHVEQSNNKRFSLGFR